MELYHEPLTEQWSARGKDFKTKCIADLCVSFRGTAVNFISLLCLLKAFTQKGEAIEHGREVSVKCVGSDQTIARTCNNGTTVTFLDCTPSKY